MFGSTTCTSAAVAVAILSFTADVVTAQNGFREIATDFKGANPTGVVLPSICIGNFIVPKAMYTIEPVEDGETDVKILTNPQDLVEMGFNENEGQIYLKFIQEISELADDAGVIIQFPPDQFESLNVCCSQSVQIKDGFTNFQSLTVSTGATVDAVFTDQQDNDMAIGVFTDAEANVDVPRRTTVEVIATDNAKVNINGDITTLDCNDQSDCMIDGFIDDRDNSRSRGRSTINTSVCTGIDVADDSICQSNTPTVVVDADQELVISGEKQTCVQGQDLEGLGGSSDIGILDPVNPNADDFFNDDFLVFSPAPTVSAAPTMVPGAESEEPTAGMPTPTLPTREPTPATFPPVSSGNAAFSGSLQRNIIIGTAIGGAVLISLFGL